MVASLENCSFLAFYKPLSVFFIEKEGFRAAYHYRVTKPCSTDLGRCRTTAVPYTVDLVDLTIQHRRFLSQRLLRRSFWREQYRAFLPPSRRQRPDTFSKLGRAYIQRWHRSYSYHNAVLICSTKSPYFLEILRNLLTNQSVVLYHMNTTEMSLL